jgi:murein DD-endopeptidase MepM/ murein hydrolase activator NlpD
LFYPSLRGRDFYFNLQLFSHIVICRFISGNLQEDEKKAMKRLKRKSSKKTNTAKILSNLKSKFKSFKKSKFFIPSIIALTLFWFYACPEKTIIPVMGAQPYNWNADYFWECPWCTNYYKHKGIDIIVNEGTPVLASTNGIVIYKGWFGIYGKAILLVSPKLRVHLYGHLNSHAKRINPFVMKGTVIGYVGNTGNSDCPHLHYTIFSILPHFWLMEIKNMGFLKMFFLNPDKIVTKP